MDTHIRTYGLHNLARRFRTCLGLVEDTTTFGVANCVVGSCTYRNVSLAGEVPKLMQHCRRLGDIDHGGELGWRWIGKHRESPLDRRP